MDERLILKITWNYYGWKLIGLGTGKITGNLSDNMYWVSILKDLWFERNWLRICNKVSTKNH